MCNVVCGSAVDCWSEKGDSKVLKSLHAENVKGILERKWSWKKGYVMKWKL